MPTRRFVLAALLLPGVVTSPLARAGQVPAFHASVDLVPITVTVEHSAGGYADGLAAAQFRLFDDGAPRDIALFDAAQVPVDLVLLLDTSSSMNARLPQMQKAATQVVRSIRPADRATIMTFGARTTVVWPLTHDTGALVRALGQLSCAGTTSLYDALYVALHEFSARGTELRRRAIVVFSDGDDTASLVSYDRVLEAARQRAVATYTVRLVSPTGSPDRFARSARELTELARETGGRAFTTKGDEQVARAYESIAHDLAHQYVLGFLPPIDTAPGVHRLTVLVNAPMVRVRARGAYLGRSGERP